MTKVLEGSLPRLGVKVNSINQCAVNVKNYSFDRQLLAPIFISKTLIYIAAKLAIEMFFPPMDAGAYSSPALRSTNHLHCVIEPPAFWTIPMQPCCVILLKL